MYCVTVSLVILVFQVTLRILLKHRHQSFIYLLFRVHDSHPYSAMEEASDLISITLAEVEMWELHNIDSFSSCSVPMASFFLTSVSDVTSSVTVLLRL